MNEQSVTLLLERQRDASQLISGMAGRILKMVDTALADDAQSIERLRILHAKDSNILHTFLKISDLLLRAFVLENRLTGTVLAKNMNYSEEDQQELELSHNDIMIIRDYLAEVEKNIKNDEVHL